MGTCYKLLILLALASINFYSFSQNVNPDTTKPATPSSSTLINPDTGAPIISTSSSPDTAKPVTPVTPVTPVSTPQTTSGTSAGTPTTPADTASKNWFDVLNKIDSANKQKSAVTATPDTTTTKQPAATGNEVKPTDGNAYNYKGEVSTPTAPAIPVSKFATAADSLQAIEDSLAAFRPYLGYGNGVFTYSGEIKDNYRNNPDVGRIGYTFSISKKVNKYLTGNFSVIFGKLSGNYRSSEPEKNMNFMTDIVDGGISLSYNFRNFIKKPGTIQPFISLGLESFEYNSKADLKDANGNTYYYWSDGSIRNVPENSPNAKSSVLLERDYVYETDLRDLNLDGFGKYQQIAFGIPLDIGVDVKVSSRVKLRLGNAWHFTFSDLIDNINSQSKGYRKGNSAPDRFMFTYVSLHFDIFSGRVKSKKDLIFEGLDIDQLYTADSDSDGVSDASDLCPATPRGVAVDPNGCPLDSDGDGVPDYLDKEPNTTKFFYVSPDGVGESEEEYEARHAADTVGIAREKIAEFYPSLQKTKPVKQFTTFYIEIPPKFRIFDTDKDGYISPQELSKAIDMFFDFESNLTVDDIYQLTDFFFGQETDKDENY